jgi:hypothetical protein
MPALVIARWTSQDPQGGAEWSLHDREREAPLHVLAYPWWGFWRLRGVTQVEAWHKQAVLPAWLISKLLRVPLVVWVRDAGALCPLGMCWTHGVICSSRPAEFRRCLAQYRWQYGQPARWAWLAWARTKVRRWIMRGAIVRAPSRGILDVIGWRR